MKVENYFDLRIANFTANEAVPEHILHQPEYDLIRIAEPTPEQCQQLQPLGFIYKPRSLFWVLLVSNTEEEFLQSFDAKERKHLRSTLRRINGAYQLCIEQKLQPETLDRWLALYQKRMKELPRGTDYATEDRQEMLEHPDYVGVYLLEQDQLIAGAICIRYPQHNMLRLIYLVSDSRYDHMNPSRYIYFVLMNIAREAGYTKLSAGADPNFYGHDVSTGLFHFKRRLGFQAEPYGQYEGKARSVLEKVLSLDACDDPSFCLGYAASSSLDLLDMHVFSRSPQAPAPTFQVSFAKHMYHHHILTR